MNTLFDIWNNIQSTLFPWLEEELCRSDTAGSKYVNRRSDCTIWHASVGYVSDIVGGTAGDFDGGSFSVGLTVF